VILFKQSKMLIEKPKTSCLVRDTPECLRGLWKDAKVPLVWLGVVCKSRRSGYA
jgi:hypothetical protein